MGKISPVSIKYIIHADIKLSSLADKPDVIGAIFGQTEGLLGPDLELRELQKAGKIGRIEVKLTNNKGKSEGEIIIPSSMGKSETAIVAASLETIDRVGPCNAKIKVRKIEDVRVAKREFILKRAEELLKQLVESLPDSQAFTNKVTQTVRTMEVQEYGEDKLPAGPLIDDSDEIIIVEGRADVLNLLKYGIRNVIGLNGSRGSKTIIDLAHKKITTLFVDGDRGGDLIARRLLQEAEIDYIARAPDGKEVEELTMKEIQKALRARNPVEHIEHEELEEEERPKKDWRRKERERPEQERKARRREPKIEIKNAKELKEMAEELIGTRGAYILDEDTNILGRVPISELPETLKDIEAGAYAIIMDGEITNEIVKLAEAKRIKLIVGNGSSSSSRVRVVNPKEL